MMIWGLAVVTIVTSDARNTVANHCGPVDQQLHEDALERIAEKENPMYTTRTEIMIAFYS